MTQNFVVAGYTIQKMMSLLSAKTTPVWSQKETTLFLITKTFKVKNKHVLCQITERKEGASSGLTGSNHPGGLGNNPESPTLLLGEEATSPVSETICIPPEAAPIIKVKVPVD